MIKINGKDVSKAAGKTLLEYLLDCGYYLSYIVAELNLRIVPKEEYKTTVLKDGDELEILNFVGGG